MSVTVPSSLASPLPASHPASLPSDPQAPSRIVGHADGLSVWPRSTRPEALAYLILALIKPEKF
ncbi:hypothetical protein [Streptomyces sp900116325]|uniref:hypothetical protein n=1 Tax=Streptomyces sp. 900116325 TaxID=3154295 RepID=UPI00331C98C9